MPFLGIDHLSPRPAWITICRFLPALTLTLATAAPLPTFADSSAEPKAAPAAPQFLDKTTQLGVDFVHRHHGTGEKYMPENMGSGLGIFDFDNDGRLDLFFVQGAPVDERRVKTGTGHRLFQQQADGTFRDVSKAAGVNLVGIGMGLCHGDVDSDGDIDLYVSQFGPDLLLRNQGDGTFVSNAQAAGLRSSKTDTLWSTGCTFFDPDLDGDLDLFVSAYVDFSLENHKYCGNAKKNLRSYCHPDVYSAQIDRFYRNDGQGHFVEAGLASGIRPSSEAKGLGVLAADFNGDGRQDVFVANDSTMNQLYIAGGDGRFAESALLVGVGYNRSGAAEAGMGVDYGDLDGDGRGELFLTHLDRETNTLYRPLADDLFADATDASGLGAPSLPWVGFGTAFIDFDLDSDLDVAVTNGHILDNIQLFSPDRRYRQPAQLFENTGKHFRELPAALENSESLVGRGLVAADLDNDGDLDLVLSQNNGPAKILINNRVGAGEPAPSIKLRLKGRASNIHGLGAKIRVESLDPSGGKEPEIQVHEVVGARGYLSQGPHEWIFGLGSAGQASKLTVHWPSGRKQTLASVPAGKTLVLKEPTTP